MVACGGGALLLPWLPGPWPNPLPEGELDLASPAIVDCLREAAATVDAACVNGDLSGFTAAVTAAHRADLGRSLEPLGLALDAAALRQLGARQAAWLDADALAGDVVGARAAIAMARPDGDGAQVLTFEWNGERMLLDGSVRILGVRDAATARTAVAAAVARR